MRFIEWDELALRVNGARLAALVPLVPPVERISLTFTDGLLRVEGSIRKFISVPFSVEIRQMIASGKTIRVPLGAATAFGAIPIPQFLFGIMRGRLPADLITLEPPATFIVSLDRFLPNFVDAEVREIRIIDGGLAVTVGRGGADLPPQSEADNG